ncbi:prepilin peptidase [Sphingobium sp. H39-3-25]|uniref:A24 family peptidase n=1 Tax=Sphingobium arseniciresistens TaxID=3030834 RepID=UPI0023B8B4A4|nr:prepilin peptidase [Sphingobium arseniciresistens]
MMGEHLQSGLAYGLLSILACLLLVAAVTDLRARIIPNMLNLAIAMLAPLFWWASGIAFWPDMPLQLGLGIAVFAAFTLLFALGMMGGGDVKMLGALALWFPWQILMAMLFAMAMIGGLVTLATIVHHRMTRQAGAPEVPYGIAISAATLWVVGQQYFNHFS